jgi:archaeosine-15-forming tRNA-guanine transglycosylase
LTHLPFFSYVKDVFVGYGAVFVLNEDDELYFMGKSDYQTYPFLHNFTTLNSTYSGPPRLVNRNELRLPEDEVFVCVSPCFSSAIAMTNKRNFYTFGQSYWFFGESGAPIFAKVPSFLQHDENVVSISSGNFHAAIVTDRHVCYIGGQREKRFGVSDTSTYHGFKPVDLVQKPIIACSCLHYMTVMTALDGTIYASFSFENGDQLAPNFIQIAHSIPGEIAQVKLSDELLVVATAQNDVYFRGRVESINEFEGNLLKQQEHSISRLNLVKGGSWQKLQLAMTRTGCIMYFSEDSNSIIKHFNRLYNSIDNRLCDIIIICTDGVV